LNEKLRAETILSAGKLHNLWRSQRTPPPQYSKKCPPCSLVHVCMPKIVSSKNDVGKYIKRFLMQTDGEQTDP